MKFLMTIVCLLMLAGFFAVVEGSFAAFTIIGLFLTVSIIVGYLLLEPPEEGGPGGH